MHHGKHFRRLNRTMSHRKSMLRNLVTQLIQHDRIKTTLPKAQELKAIADQMITLGKRGDLHAKVQAASYLREHETTLPKLFGPLAERFKNRKGGYTRIHKMGNRFGDNAPVAVIELIDGPGDLKNQILFKALARQESAKSGSIKEIVEINKEKLTTTEGLKNKAIVRHIPKVLASNKWELADLERKVAEMSIQGNKAGKIFDATETKA
ncbi:MAG: ribosomal protein L17 [Linnemannia gamsii]|nr:MAG: ribosomal protein L17 [Linnemannia gamsii]